MNVLALWRASSNADCRRLIVGVNEAHCHFIGGGWPRGSADWLTDVVVPLTVEELGPAGGIRNPDDLWDGVGHQAEKFLTFPQD